MSLQRPKRIRPQLLVIPNHAEVVAAFRRASTFDLRLIAIELERSESLIHGSQVELVAFTSSPSLTIRHLMGTEEPSLARLLGAAEILAQTASARARQKMGDQHGRQGAAGGIQRGGPRVQLRGGNAGV